MRSVSVRSGRQAPDAPVIPERPVFFFHVPKTGGRTVERFLAAKFGADVYHPKRNKKWFAGLAASKIGDRETPCGRHIVGHTASWSLLEGAPQRYQKICFWRHPADWFLSFYNYRIHRTAHRFDQPFAFEDFRRSMLRNPMTECLLLKCGDVRAHRYFLMSDDEKFLRAARLLRKFDTFSDIGEVDGVLRGIAGDDASIPHFNRLRNKQLQRLDQHVRAEIVSDNPVDYYLHKLTLTADHANVIREARTRLNRRFAFGDVLRLIALPYNRLKIWHPRLVARLRSPLGSAGGPPECRQQALHMRQ